MEVSMLVVIPPGTGEILANHTFTSGGAFYGEIRLVSISTGWVVASVPITMVMNLGDIPTAVPTIAVVDVATPTSTVSAGPTPTFTPTIGPTPVPSGSKIAFKSFRDGNDEIYMMDADGSSQTRLTTNSADDR